jgi:hypothetical protein
MERSVAFLMPKGAMLGVIENNATLGLILHLDACPDYYFYLQPQWMYMTNVIPMDSLFHVLLYVDRSNNVRMGMFDMSLFYGVAQTDLDVLKRHEKLYRYLCDYRQQYLHMHHWIGYAGTCFDFFDANTQQTTLPFDVSHIAIITDDSYVLRKVIRPIHIKNKSHDKRPTHVRQ